MSDTVIRVENLSKRYRIGHQANKRAHHSTLRDVVVREASNLARKTVDFIRRRAIVDHNNVEDFWALKDVNFEVKQGEVIGIIGRNGAGKSTLLKILSRITDPTEGQVTLRGRVGSLLEVGTGFHQELTGRENIFLNGAILGMSQREVRRRFDEIVAFAEVERFLDTPVKRYSSGMYVRLAFAVAAHLEPEILVVDEVLAVGDIEFQQKCLGKMSQIAGGGRTVLFVSHNHAAVQNLCSHGLVIQHGRASPKQDIRAALTQYSAERLGRLTTSWTRPVEMDVPSIYFESIDVRVEGVQPKLTVICAIRIRAKGDVRPAILAVDILDHNSSTIMQAYPRSAPFIGTDEAEWLDMRIELPPLVPGVYHLDFWIGPHHSETYDYIRDELSIEVIDSPSPQRSFPHTPDHGCIVPNSEVVVLSPKRTSSRVSS